MGTTKFYFGFIMIVLTLGTLMFNSSLINETSSSITTSSQFEAWRPDNMTLSSLSCGCHDEVISGNGILNVLGTTTIEALSTFNLQFNVSGFTEAQNGEIVMGLNHIDANNSLFTSQGETLFQSSIVVDASGNSNYANFEFKSPLKSGNYTLLIYAVHGDKNEFFSYISKSVDITVTPVNDTTIPVIQSFLVNDASYTPGMTIQGTTTIKTNVTDNFLSSVKYTVDNNTYTDMSYNSISTLYEANISSNSFSGNSIVLTIFADDKGGNNATKSYLLNLNNTGLLPNADIITYKVENSINLDDQEVDQEWSDVSETSIAEFGTGGFIKSIQDGMYLYTLMAFESSLNWISVEMNVSESGSSFMNSGQDGWVFGTGNSANYYGDYYFSGMSSSPQKDSRDDVFYEVIEKDGLTYIESARLLNTQDTSGKDFEFTTGQTFNVVFASNVHHTGDHQIMSWIITDISPTAGKPNDGVIPNLKQAFNLQEISDIVFVLSFVIVLVTVFMHISLRVVSRPITHEKRIIYTDKIPNQPTSTSLIKNFLFKSKQKNLEEKK